MRKKLVYTFAIAIIAIVFFSSSLQVLASDSSYGIEVPDLLELYESYYDTDYEALYFEEATSEYSSYCIIQEMPDAGYIQFYGSASEDVNVNDLRQTCGYSEEEIFLRCNYIKRTECWSLNMTFLTYDHDANYEAALKITEAIAEKHVLKSAYINVDGKNIIRQNRTCWNLIRRIDEFGIESPLTEELTSKQISDLNTDIAENGYKASIDEENGKVIFDEVVTEKEKFEFAIWFKDNYGFYAYTYSASLLVGTTPYERKELYYTDVKGDVNNDGLFNVSDLVMLQQFLLGNGTLYNWNNADLCTDNCIDIFDMIFVRYEFLESGSTSII